MRPTAVASTAKALRYLPRPARRNASGQAGKNIAQLLEWQPSEEVENITVNGYVRSIRSFKNVTFVNLADGSSLKPLQTTVDTEKLGKGLSTGTAVRFTGSWTPSQGKNQSHEMRVQKIDVLGPSDSKTNPIQKKYMTPEFLRNMPHLRTRVPMAGVRLRLRSAAIASLTQFFASRSFTQTHPPIITSSDCEGAGEVFTLVPVSQLSDVFAGKSSLTEGGLDPFFRDSKYLTVSTQLHLEALAQSVGDVWALSPTFRAEKSDTSRHLSEFYMLEAEMTFIDDLKHVMDHAEDMLRHLASDLYDSQVFRELMESNTVDLVPGEVRKQRWDGLMQKDWPRITYTEAISILEANAESFTHKPVWGEGLQSEHEKFLANHVGGGEKPVFVTNYPRDIKAFYMKQSAPVEGGGPGETVECFDLLVPDFCEIMGGSMREHRLDQLLDAMRSHDIPVPDRAAVDVLGGTHSSGGTLDWYVDLRRWGCPPHGGFGLGFDRFLAYLSGVQTIRDIVAFPRWFGRCDC